MGVLSVILVQRHLGHRMAIYPHNIIGSLLMRIYVVHVKNSRYVNFPLILRFIQILCTDTYNELTFQLRKVNNIIG